MAKELGVTAKPKLISYRYVATTTQGRQARGTIKAVYEVAAERSIVDRGLNPVSVEVVPSVFSLEEAFPSFFKVKPRDVIIFSRQLATLLRSGISLLPSLEILESQVTSGRAFRKIMGTMIDDIRAGSSFFQSVSKHPTAFTEIYIRTIDVGERSGNLETVLNQMADYHEKQGEITGKVKKALSYPIMVMMVGVVVTILFLTVVLPQMKSMFASLNVELPLPTKILLAVSNLITTKPLYLVVGGTLLIALLLWLMKIPSGKKVFDRLRLTAPVMGTPLLLGELARFCRTISLLIGSGLSLQEIMEIMPLSTSNSYLRDVFNEVREGLLLGEGLSQPMSRVGIFPPLLVQMVGVGEESNTLDFTLGVVADFYEASAEEKMTALVGMIGPLSTIGIALLVGFLAISIMMPIYTLTGAFD